MSFSTIVTLVIIVVAIRVILPFVIPKRTTKKESISKNDLTPQEISKSYESRKALLTQAELQFFQVLKEAIPSSYHVSIKVRWADIFQVKKGFAENIRHGLFSRIKSKHIDFVLIHNETGRIECLIELDDASHNTPKAMKRDKFQAELAKVCGIPLLRQNFQRQYIAAEVKTSVLKAVNLACEKCGCELVKREKVHESGKSFVFMGCSEFPKCDFTRNLF